MSQADTQQQVSMAGDFLRATLELQEEVDLDLRSLCFPPPKKEGKKKAICSHTGTTGSPSIISSPPPGAMKGQNPCWMIPWADSQEQSA